MLSLLFLTTLLSAFFSTTSAFITLGSNFQEFKGISKDSTAYSNCLALYNSRIPQCTDTIDFLPPNYCTSDCQQALRNMEAKLNNFCKGVEAEDKSLLAAIFGRRLVESVCRDDGATGPQSSAKVSTTTKMVSTQTRQTTVTASPDDGVEVTGGDARTTLEASSSSSVTVTLSSSSVLNTPPVSASQSFTPLPTPTTQRPAPAETSLSWREKVAQDQACAILEGGGGSPFDSMVSFPNDDKTKQQQLDACAALNKEKSGGSHSHKPSSMVAVVIGVGIGLMVLF